MNIIRRFVIAWQDAKLRQQYEEFADDPEYWTKEDCIWLAQTLAQPVGQKLLKRLNNMVMRGAIDATRRTLNQRYHCGIVRGMTLLKESIDRDFMAGISLASAQSGKTEPAQTEREDAELEQLLAQIQ